MTKLLILNAILVIALITSCSKNTVYYVSSEGSDKGKGTKSSPFKTLERTRDEIQKLKNTGQFPINGITIYFREGIYPITQTIKFKEVDNGLPEVPVKYQAYPEEKVIFTGGIRLKTDVVEKVTDKSILNRIIDKKAAEQLLQINLKALGIKDYGENLRRGNGIDLDKTKLPIEILIDGKRLQIARWPNGEDFVQMDKIIDIGVDWEGRKGLGESDASTGSMVYEEPRGGTFSYTFNRPELWKSDEAFVNGVITESWVWNNVKVSIDKEKKQIKLHTPIVYGLIKRRGKQHYFHFEDILEELDVPGEYWLDRTKGILYFLPPEDYNSSSQILVSMLKEPMFEMKNVSNVIFSNITFDGSRNTCFKINEGNNIKIKNCEIRNFLLSAVSINGGNDHGIYDSHIYNIGTTVLNIEGGDWETLSPSNFEIINNHIHSYAYYIPSGSGAILLSGVGTRILNNLIHDAPHWGIRFTGNDHLIKNNEIYNVTRDFFDAGVVATHTGYNPTWRGTIIANNYFHDIGFKMEGVKCIYTDGASFGVTIEKNIFANIGTNEVQNNAINNNTGSYIKIQNNIFINCSRPLKNYFYLSQRNKRRFNRYKKQWEELFAKYDFSKMPHGKKYPELLNFWDEDRDLPSTNTFTNNAIYNTEVELLDGEYIGTMFNKGIPIEKLVEISGNIVFESDPGFVNYSEKDFRLQPNADIFKKIPGFEDVHFEKMGFISSVGSN